MNVNEGNQYLTGEKVQFPRKKSVRVLMTKPEIAREKEGKVDILDVGALVNEIQNPVLPLAYLRSPYPQQLYHPLHLRPWLYTNSKLTTLLRANGLLNERWYAADKT